MNIFPKMQLCSRFGRWNSEAKPLYIYWREQSRQLSTTRDPCWGLFILANAHFFLRKILSPMAEVELVSDSRLEQDVKLKMEQPGKPTKTESVSFLGLFSAADATDFVLMFLGSVGACVHGAALPVFFVLFGRMIDSLGHLSKHPHKLSSRISEVQEPYPNFKCHYHYYCIFILVPYSIQCMLRLRLETMYLVWLETMHSYIHLDFINIHESCNLHI